jgi:hypothetical protein
MSVPLEPEPGRAFVQTDELVRRQGVLPLSSVEDLVLEDLFSSDEGHSEFFRDLYDSRHAPHEVGP